MIAGLAHAHAHDVVHRDLKPANILVAVDELGGEHVRIADFGLAKVGGLSISQHLAIGTPSYMSPEQTRGEAVDARADVYAVGVLLFELLVDRVPFEGADLFEVMRLHREAPVPWFDDVAPDHLVLPAVERVVRTALAKCPEDRYASAGALAAALDRAVVEEEDECDVAELIAAASTAWPRRVALAAVAAGACALVALL